MFSPASGPIKCAPTTRSLAWYTTSFMKVFSSRPLMLGLMGLKVDLDTRIRPNLARASSSVNQHMPMFGWQKTSVGMKS